MTGFFPTIHCCLWSMLLLSLSRAVPVSWSPLLQQEDPYVPPKRPSLNNQVCTYENEIYHEGQKHPTSNPCETCVCQPPGFSCSLRTCEVKPGCKALQIAGQCCPEYLCDCQKNGRTYGNGEKVEEPNPCNVCYCRGGEIQCTGVSCYTRDDCEPHYVPGKCCPKYDHCPAIEMASKTPITPSSTVSDEEISSPYTNSSTTVAAYEQVLGQENKTENDPPKNTHHVGTLEIIEVYPSKEDWTPLKAPDVSEVPIKQDDVLTTTDLQGEEGLPVVTELEISNDTRSIGSTILRKPAIETKESADNKIVDTVSLTASNANQINVAIPTTEIGEVVSSTLLRDIVEGNKKLSNDDYKTKDIKTDKSNTSLSEINIESSAFSTEGLESSTQSGGEDILTKEMPEKRFEILDTKSSYFDSDKNQIIEENNEPFTVSVEGTTRTESYDGSEFITEIPQVSDLMTESDFTTLEPLTESTIDENITSENINSAEDSLPAESSIHLEESTEIHQDTGYSVTVLPNLPFKAEGTTLQISNTAESTVPNISLVTRTDLPEESSGLEGNPTRFGTTEDIEKVFSENRTEEQRAATEAEEVAGVPEETTELSNSSSTDLEETTSYPATEETVEEDIVSSTESYNFTVIDKNNLMVETTTEVFVTVNRSTTETILEAVSTPRTQATTSENIMIVTPEQLTKVEEKQRNTDFEESEVENLTHTDEENFSSYTDSAAVETITTEKEPIDLTFEPQSNDNLKDHGALASVTETKGVEYSIAPSLDDFSESTNFPTGETPSKLERRLDNDDIIYYQSSNESESSLDTLSDKTTKNIFNPYDSVGLNPNDTMAHDVEIFNSPPTTENTTNLEPTVFSNYTDLYEIQDNLTLTTDLNETGREFTVHESGNYPQRATPEKMLFDFTTEQSPIENKNITSQLAEILLKWLQMKRSNKGKIHLNSPKKKIEEERPMNILAAFSNELLKIVRERNRNNTQGGPRTVQRIVDVRKGSGRSLEVDTPVKDQDNTTNSLDIEDLARKTPSEEPSLEDDETPIHIEYPYTDENLAPVLSMISDQLQFLKVGEEQPIYMEPSPEVDNRSPRHGIIIRPTESPITVEMVKVVNGVPQNNESRSEN